MANQSIKKSLATLTTKEAGEVRVAIASQRQELTEKAVAKENRRAAEITQEETDAEAIRKAYEKLGIKPK